MATAVQTPPTPGTAPNPRLKLAIASLVGALFVLGAIAAAAYAVPLIWTKAISPILAPLGSFVDGFLLIVAILAVVIAVIFGGVKLLGSNPPHGLRGGIFLVAVYLLAALLIAREVGVLLLDSGFGAPVMFVVLGGLLGLGYKLIVSNRGENAMHAIDTMGWLHTFNYKKSQGLKARRYSMIGFLLLGWTGVWTIINHGSIGTGDWVLSIPYANTSITPLSNVQYSVPILLAVLTFWVSWRAVNVPAFADFLIATEAEMNKVSWPTKKKLVQDTIVVLVTVFLLTLFLLIIDLFWGWFLSREIIHVLPSKSGQGAIVDPVQGKKVDW